MNEPAGNAPHPVMSGIAQAAVIAAEPRTTASRRAPRERGAWARTPWRVTPTVVTTGGWGRRRS